MGSEIHRDKDVEMIESEGKDMSLCVQTGPGSQGPGCGSYGPFIRFIRGEGSSLNRVESTRRGSEGSGGRGLG